MNFSFRLQTIDEAVNWFLKNIEGKKIFAFYGSMGVGKTTFIESVCRTLGVADSMNSPTFSIINEYETTFGEKIYHIDLYRLAGEEEALDAGVEEYLHGNNYCFVEWPEKASNIFPEETVHVNLKIDDDGLRNLSIKH